MESAKILAEEFRRNDQQVKDSAGNIVGSVERYLYMVLPKDVSTMVRAVAYDELMQQEVKFRNPASHIIVDNFPASQRGILRAMRRVVMRFQDIDMLVKAVREIYNLLQQITRIESPPKNSIVARKNFHLWIDHADMGLLPAALARLSTATVKRDSVVRVVGPLVPYGRKLFWNPVGAAPKIQVRRHTSRRSASGYRFSPMRGASRLAPRFRPYALSTVRRRMRGNSAAAQFLRSAMGSGTPPGRLENAGQIVKRVIRRNAQYRGLHFTDGWVNYGPAAGWGQTRDTRVPAFGVMFSKKGMV